MRFRPFFTIAVILVVAANVVAGERPNILLLTVDTLRADKLGCYGYERPTSPNIDRLAAEGLLFEDATCEVPLTAPSFGAMFVSRPPRVNGATRNGIRLPDEIKTAPQLLQEAGYHTLCVQSNWTLKAKLSGIERGFDIYDDDFHDKRWGIIKPERHGQHVTELALKYLAERDPSRPFFAWVHYSDPHAPYKLHKEFNVWKKAGWKLNKVDKVRAKYDSEIAFTDNELAKVLAVLPENTAVVFLSDHGESLYEHDYLGHGRRIYQNNMLMPFIVRAPGVAPGRSDAPARGMDVGPTLLGLAGIPVPESMTGVDVLKAPPAADRLRIYETYGGAVPNLPGAESVMSMRGPMRQGVVLGDWKLIVDGKREELYNLSDDPGELKDLHKKNTGKVAELRQHLALWEKAYPQAQEKVEALSEEDKQALEAFGYLK